MAAPANPQSLPAPAPDPRSGYALPTVIAVGVILTFLLVPAYYKVNATNRFVGQAVRKVQAGQAAEAGVEALIADLGSRALRVAPGMDSLRYNGMPLGPAAYTVRLRANHATPDTVDVDAQGTMGKAVRRVLVRLKLFPKVDSIPALSETPEYLALLANPPKKVDICHLPPGNPSNAQDISIAWSALKTHLDHHGDYIGKCDAVLSQQHAFPDTSVKVKIISWQE